jgi:hypothetical protein
MQLRFFESIWGALNWIYRSTSSYAIASTPAECKNPIGRPRVVVRELSSSYSRTEAVVVSDRIEGPA